MVEGIEQISELTQQINYLKLYYANYLNLVKQLHAMHPTESKENEDAYFNRIKGNFDNARNEGIINIVAAFSSAATFVALEVESLKDILPEKEVEQIKSSYELIETNANPKLKDCKAFVQAANNLKVKLGHVKETATSSEQISSIAGK